MKAIAIDTREAEDQFKWYAARDAQLRSTVNKTAFSQAKKTQAVRMQDALGVVYRATNVFVEYRKTLIAIKVQDPIVADRKNLRLLERDWTLLGITKVKSKQGITYRIPK